MDMKKWICLFLSLCAFLFADQSLTHRGTYTDSTLERIDFLDADEGVNAFFARFAVFERYRCAKTDRTVGRGFGGDDFRMIKNFIELSQAAVDVAQAHFAVGVGRVFGTVSFGGGSADLALHFWAFDKFEAFPFLHQFIETFFRNWIRHSLQYRNF